MFPSGRCHCPNTRQAFFRIRKLLPPGPGTFTDTLGVAMQQCYRLPSSNKAFFDLGVLAQGFVVIMSYQTKIDQMVGKHVAEFQMEISAAKKLQESESASPMVFGYPAGVYHPTAVVERPHVSRTLSNPTGKMSNGVPWLLSLDLVNQYTLGLYNPVRH